MPAISPFRACRAVPQYVERFSASAYDVAVQNEDYTSQKENDITFLRIQKPAGFIKGHLVANDYFEISRSTLKEIVKQGILIQDETESIYIYRQIKDGHTYTGIIGLVPIQAYRDGHIKKHEKTRTVREKEIAEYFNEVRLSGSPVLLTYRDNDALEAIIEDVTEPDAVYHFITRTGTDHYLWKIEDKDRIDLINSYLSKIEDFYIADGHHRCAGYSVIKNNAPSGFMACLIPASQLHIQSFYRLIQDLNGMDKSSFLNELGKSFSIVKLSSVSRPIAEGIIHLYIDGECYALNIPNELKDKGPKSSLDVSILENLVIKNILNIADSKTSDRITFVNGSETVESIISSLAAGTARLAFDLYPLRIENVIDVSDAGKTMPPKSTWIEPKLRSGLVIHSF